MIDRLVRSLLALPGKRQVQGDPVQPGIERARSLKALQPQKRLHERILHQIAGVLARTHDVHHRVVQPVLIATHQLSERSRVAGETCSDKVGFVIHGCSKILDAVGRRKVPRLGVRLELKLGLIWSTRSIELAGPGMSNYLMGIGLARPTCLVDERVRSTIRCSATIPPDCVASGFS